MIMENVSTKWTLEYLELSGEISKIRGVVNSKSETSLQKIHNFETQGTHKDETSRLITNATARFRD